MGETMLSELISKERINARLKELADEINKDYAGKTLVMVCVLKGAFMFASDLSKLLEADIEMGFLDISSYGGGTSSSGIIKIEKDLDFPVTGKNVLIVEDIIDSGRTLSALAEHLRAQKPGSLKICAMLNKPSRRIVYDAEPDYFGFEIPDVFVVGYGLDYAQKYRQLPYIASVTFK